MAEAFLDVHRLAVKAMAGQDDAMLDVVARLLTFETTVGDVTLDELRRTEPLLRYVTSVTDFQQVAPSPPPRGCRSSTPGTRTTCRSSPGMRGVTPS